MCGNMLATDRKDYILASIKRVGTVTVRQLALQLHVTEVTIRRDLEEMEAQGLLERVHGGARRLEKKGILSFSSEYKMMDRLQFHYPQKDVICKKAASMIEDGDCVFIDGGTSLLPILPYIASKRIKIVTHNILIQQAFESTEAELFCLGGRMVPDYKMTVGPIAMRALDAFNFDLTLIGCAGINMHTQTVYTAEMDTMIIKQKAMQNSHKSYLLVDSSKTNVKGFCNFTSFSSFDGILIDENLQTNEYPANFILVPTKDTL